MEQGNAVGGLDSPLQEEIKVCRWHSLSNLAKQVKVLRSVYTLGQFQQFKYALSPYRRKQFHS